MSLDADLLRGLRDQVVTPVATGPVTLYQLSDDEDVQTAIGFTRGPTDPFGRWGQGILLLLSRGERSDPLTVHDNASPVVKALIAVAGVTFGTVTVNTVEHRGSSAGPDASKRTVRADTFFLDFDLGYQA